MSYGDKLITGSVVRRHESYGALEVPLLLANSIRGDCQIPGLGRSEPIKGLAFRGARICFCRHVWLPMVAPFPLNLLVARIYVCAFMTMTD